MRLRYKSYNKVIAFIHLNIYIYLKGFKYDGNFYTFTHTYHDCFCDVIFFSTSTKKNIPGYFFLLHSDYIHILSINNSNSVFKQPNMRDIFN